MNESQGPVKKGTNKKGPNQEGQGPNRGEKIKNNKNVKPAVQGPVTTIKGPNTVNTVNAVKPINNTPAGQVNTLQIIEKQPTSETPETAKE